MNQLFIDVGLSLVGLIVTTYGVKLVRVYPLLSKAITYAKEEAEARKDGKLTTAEKAKLYDSLESVVREAWSILKSWHPFKSK